MREILEKKKEESARVAPGRGRGHQMRLRLLPVLIAMAIAATGFNLTQALRAPTYLAPNQQRGLTVANIYLAVAALEAYRDSTGRLSPQLEVLGGYPHGLEYHVAGDRYSLQAQVGEEIIRYRSGEALPELNAAVTAVRRPGGGGQP